MDREERLFLLLVLTGDNSPTTTPCTVPDEVDALTSDTSIVTESLNECTWTLTIPVKAHPSKNFVEYYFIIFKLQNLGITNNV